MNSHWNNGCFELPLLYARGFFLFRGVWNLGFLKIVDSALGTDGFGFFGPSFFGEAPSESVRFLSIRTQCKGETPNSTTHSVRIVFLRLQIWSQIRMMIMIHDDLRVEPSDLFFSCGNSIVSCKDRCLIAIPYRFAQVSHLWKSSSASRALQLRRDSRSIPVVTSTVSIIAAYRWGFAGGVPVVWSFLMVNIVSMLAFWQCRRYHTFPHLPRFPCDHVQCACPAAGKNNQMFTFHGSKVHLPPAHCLLWGSVVVNRLETL